MSDTTAIPTAIAAQERLVVYSLALPTGAVGRDLIWQFAGSVRTLREHNQDIPIVLFVHGAVPDELVRTCDAHAVTLREQGSYAARLAALCPTGWPALARNPLLHRFLSLGELAVAESRQIMICDCDTIFFRDVAELFDRYVDADVVAREEVRSRRTSFGIDRSFIDDPLLARLASHEGVAAVPPFNVGVVLLNNGVTGRLGALQDQFVDYAWRFVVGMVVEQGDAPAGGEFCGLAEARLHATDSDVMRALPYPSANRWLVDEVAWWMTLGHIPDLRIGDFDAADVAEHGEFDEAADRHPTWVMCRYDARHRAQIAAWLDDQRLTSAT